jgi:uncharacterized damage-inducible protein DinB
MNRILWVEKQFDFGFPVEHSVEILERLRGTPARIEDRLSSLQPDWLTRRPGDKWSIQEHAGHLIDVEGLFLQRMDDYDAGAATLRAADQSGQRTYAADYNAAPLAEILRRFRAERLHMIQRLEALHEAGFARSAMHPRLDRPMRVCDQMFFEAEHDDYHLARITELIRWAQTA